MYLIPWNVNCYSNIWSVLRLLAWNGLDHHLLRMGARNDSIRVSGHRQTLFVGRYTLCAECVVLS